HKAGIREYWLIDARGEQVSFLLYVWTATGYKPVEPRDGWQASPVFGREFQITRDRNRLDRSRYELRHQAAQAC
ncbi:MAG TPA: hypothetical protein VEQ85_07905, partial [Lacipirellulaceae bacterium]|nr:hypothetical protein [Lacipirellulaceae bacterium]